VENIRKGNEFRSGISSFLECPVFLFCLSMKMEDLPPFELSVITYHFYELTYQNIWIFIRTAAKDFAVGRTPWSRIGSLHDE